MSERDEMAAGACPVGKTALPDLRLVDETGSTNDDAKALAMQGASAGTVVAARRQTAGRGRRGHVWVSPAGSLYLSVVLRPRVGMHLFCGLPAVCALGALDALRDDLNVPGVALKWPNDVLLGPGKLAGILVEAGHSPQGTFAVCGIGVNVAHPDADVPATGSAAAEPSFDSPLALPRACLAEALPPEALPAFDGLARMLRDRICARVDAWEADVAAGRAQAGPLAPVLNEYFDSVPLLGHRVDVCRPDGSSLGSGLFAGVDCWGRATVRMDASGQVVEYAAEQVSLRAR